MSTQFRSMGIVRNRNFVPPQTPPLKIWLCLAWLLFSFQSAKSQNLIVERQKLTVLEPKTASLDAKKAQNKPETDKTEQIEPVLMLPGIDSLESSLKSYYNQMWTAEMEAYNYSQKGKWLNYMPGIGITLGMPSVSYSSQALYTYIDSKRARTAALKSMERKYTIQYNEELNRLRIEYEKLKLMKYKLQVQEQAISTERKIFAIHLEAYTKKEMKPLEYLTRLKAMESIEGSYSIAEQDYSISVLEVMKLARYGLKQHALYYENEECILLARESNGR